MASTPPLDQAQVNLCCVVLYEALIVLMLLAFLVPRRTASNFDGEMARGASDALVLATPICDKSSTSSGSGFHFPASSGVTSDDRIRLLPGSLVWLLRTRRQRGPREMGLGGWSLIVKSRGRVIS